MNSAYIGNPYVAVDARYQKMLDDDAARELAVERLVGEICRLSVEEFASMLEPNGKEVLDEVIQDYAEAKFNVR
jgi:hypothetical protein